jgi:hypothetical protein
METSWRQRSYWDDQETWYCVSPIIHRQISIAEPSAYLLFSESYQLALQSLDQMRGNILAYRYRLPTRLIGPEHRHDVTAIFERAVARLILKHPNLHLGIVGEHTSTPSWVHIEQLDLRDHIEWIRVEEGAKALQDSFRKICYQELDTKFTNYRTRPGWSLKVLRQEGSDSIEVILVLNHTNMGTRARVRSR